MNPHISHQKNFKMVPFSQATNYHLKSEVPIALHCQLCSTRYTALQIKNCLKSTSTIKLATMNNTNGFHYKGKPSVTSTKLTHSAVSEDEWDIKEDIHEECIVHTAVCQKAHVLLN